MKELYNDSYLKKSTEVVNLIKQKSYEILPLNGEENILEIGCGNGYDAIELAKRVGAEGKVVGIDVDADLIEVSKKNALDKTCKNVEFVVSDAEDIPFEDNYFNIIRAERVFQHLKNPLKVMNEALRVLKPGGMIVLIETDWYGMNIYIEDSILEQKIINSLVNKVLINGNASREILSYYKRSEVKNIQMQLFPVVINNYTMADQLIKFDLIKNIGKKSDILDNEDIENWNEKIDFLVKNDCFNLSTNMILYSGNKV